MTKYRRYGILHFMSAMHFSTITTACKQSLIALGAHLSGLSGLPSREAYITFRQAFFSFIKNDQELRQHFAESAINTKQVMHHACLVYAVAGPHNAPACLEGLFRVASADGAISHAKIEWLKTIAATWGIKHRQFEVFRHRYAGARSNTPYAVLGVGSFASDEAIRKAYRALIRDFHPDRVAVLAASRRAQQEATERALQINEAYDTIARERGFKKAA